MVFLVPLVACMVLVSCCCNVVVLELMVRQDPGVGITITFAQFLFVATEGLLVAGSLKYPPKIPLKEYGWLVMLFFVVSVISNYAFSLDVPMPLVLILKSGSLMTNLLLGVVVLKKRYPISQYVGLVLITLGIVIATLASSGGKHHISNDVTVSQLGSVNVLTGVALLLLSLVLSSWMGIIQELMYRQHGKHIREAMFYTHALPIPGFLVFAPEMWRHAVSFTTSAPINIGPLSMPSMWLYLLVNTITQYGCIRAVFTLSATAPSLTVTLVVTLRKFLSLLVSIFYFSNPFTPYHWAGTVAVFLGTLLFSLNDLLPTKRKVD